MSKIIVTIVESCFGCPNSTAKFSQESQQYTLKCEPMNKIIKNDDSIHKLCPLPDKPETLDSNPA